MGAKYNLSGLEAGLKSHGELLKKNKVFRLEDKNGKKVLVEVNKTVKDAAIGALQAAEESLAFVCQQGVLAIELEPPDDEGAE